MAKHRRSPSTDAPLLPGSGSAFEIERSTSDPSAFPQIKQVGWRQLSRSIWVVSVAFFTDPDSRCKAWAMASMVLLMMLGFSALNIWFLQMFRTFQNALHDKDKETFYSSVYTICIVALGIMPVIAVRDALKGSLALEWRRYLTRTLLMKYIGESQAYYRLKFQGCDLDNPDQRIAQDPGEFTSALLNFLATVLQAMIIIITQSGMLIAISSELFLFVVGYALFINGFTFAVFGGRLTSINRKTLAQEASLRFGLVRIRENAEPIAFYQGAHFEQARCGDFFAELMSTLYHKLCLTVTFDSLMHLMGTLMSILPYCVVAGKYLAGDLDFGAMSEAAMVLGGLEGAFTTLVGQMQAVTAMGAQAVRIRQLWDALDVITLAHTHRDVDDGTLLDRGGELGVRSIGLAEFAASAASRPGDVLLRLEDVTLRSPHGQVPLVHDLCLELRVKESLLVSGPSGIGKSSLLRAIGGLWAGGCGAIERVASSQCFFVPQEPYLCLGTLRENATYPGAYGKGDATSPLDGEIRAALADVNMGYLLDRFDLDERVDLDTVLSGGERQRLGFARLLLRPAGLRFAIMDEATSALDEANENKVYKLLRHRVLGYISVGHRANLENFHTHKLVLERTTSGSCAWHLARTEAAAAAAAERAGEAALSASAGDRPTEAAVDGRGTARLEDDADRQHFGDDRWSPL